MYAGIPPIEVIHCSAIFYISIYHLISYGVMIAGPDKRGHHMGDYIPLEELNKFMSSCNDVAAQKAAQEAADRAKIQADNIGHKLLSKMGWKEGLLISHPCISHFF